MGPGEMYIRIFGDQMSFKHQIKIPAPFLSNNPARMNEIRERTEKYKLFNIYEKE